jgi:predicted nuclease of predicted toxin-antitoxin system
VLEVACIYSNENFPQPVVAELRRLGHDVLTVLEMGAANRAIPDEEVLAFAAALNRVVLTLNRKDFIRLHRERPDHAGIVVCTFDVDFAQQAKRIHAAIESGGDLTGRLLRINRPA